MTFLDPIPAIIAAAITVPALVLLYFLKLRRRPIRVSSTLLWDQAVRDLQVNIPFRLIRPTWLLVLQLAILALFLLAMARPALDLPRGVPSRVVILIDRSASMSALDGDVSGLSRLEVAKDRAIESIRQLSRSPGTSFAVATFGAEAIVLSPFSNDPGAAAAAVRGITATDQPGNLQAALQLASGLFTVESDEAVARARGLTILYSDGSFSDDGPYTLSGAEFRFQRIGPGDAPADNAGIVALAARREWEDPTHVRVFLRVQNSGEQAVSVPIALTLDGKEVGGAALQVPGVTRATDGTSWRYGQASTSLKIDTRAGGVATVRLARPDLLSSDNEASIVLTPAAKPVIIIVKPDPAPGGSDFSWLIADIIREMQLPLRVMTSSEYARGTTGNESLVIFDGVTPPKLPRCASLSFGAPIPGISASVAGRETYALSWKRSHPCLRNAPLDGVYVKKPLIITDAPSDAELARGLDGPLMIEVADAGVRRIVVAFEPALTNWPRQVSFPIFIASAIEYLATRPDEQAGGAFTTGEAATIDAAVGAITVDGPMSQSIRNTAAGPTSLGVLPLTGIYRVVEQGKEPRPLAINLVNENESSLRTAAQLEVSGQTVAAGSADDGPREVWPWFVMVALALLCVEWLVNAWLMRV